MLSASEAGLGARQRVDLVVVRPLEEGHQFVDELGVPRSRAFDELFGVA